MTSPDPVELRPLYESLELPPGEERERRFTAAVVPGYERYRIGRDWNGFPALLISTGGAEMISHPPPLRLERLDVQHNAPCRVHVAGASPTTEHLTVVRCTAADLAPYFLRIAASMIVVLGTNPSPSEISDTIDRLVQLFQAVNRPAKGYAQGLWAELLLIAEAIDPRTVVEAWRAEPTDRFDFSLGNQRVEVKSASGYQRKHHFSLEQLRPPANVEVLIASVFVERAGGGPSLRDMMDRVQASVGGAGELPLRVEHVVATTLGSSFQSGLQESFDLEHARATLRFFLAEDVPSVGTVLSPAVTAVQFISELSELTALEPSDYSARGKLFGALPQTGLSE